MSKNHSIKTQTLRAAVMANSHKPKAFKNKKAYSRKVKHKNAS